MPNEAYCIEEKNNDSTEFNNTIKGLIMFAGSVGLMLALQYLTNNPGIDPSTLGDIIHNIPVESLNPEPVQNNDIYITNLSEYANFERKGVEKVWVELPVQKQLRQVDLIHINELRELSMRNGAELESLQKSLFCSFQYHQYLQGLVSRDFLPYMAWLKKTSPDAYNEIFGVLEKK